MKKVTLMNNEFVDFGGNNEKILRGANWEGQERVI